MIHMPDELYDVPLPIPPSLWDWPPGLIGLLALLALIVGPLISSWIGRRLQPGSAICTDEAFTDKGFALLRDLIIVIAVCALAFITHDIDPPEGAWFTSITWHLFTLVVGVAAVFWLRQKAEKRGKVLMRNPFIWSNGYLLIVYGIIVSCAMAAVPAIAVEMFSKDVIGAFLAMIYVACFFGFLAVAWLCRVIIELANDERARLRWKRDVRNRVEDRWPQFTN